MGVRTRSPHFEHSYHPQWDAESLLSSATSAEIVNFGEVETSLSSSAGNMAAGRRSRGKSPHRDTGDESSPLELYEVKGRRSRRATSGDRASPLRRDDRSGSGEYFGRVSVSSSVSSSLSSGDHPASSSTSSSSDRSHSPKGHRQQSPGRSSPRSTARKESVVQANFSPTHRGLSPFHAALISHRDDQGRPVFPPHEDALESTKPNPSPLPSRSTSSSSSDNEINYSGPVNEAYVEIFPVSASPEEIEYYYVQERIPEAEPIPEPEPDSVRASEPEPVHESEPEPVHESEPEPVHESEREAKPESKSESDSTKEHEDDESVPPEYAEAANQLGIPLDDLADLFKKEGLIVDKAFVALQYAKYIVEEARVQLRCSRQEPVLGFQVLDRPQQPYRSLLLPDVKVSPTVEASAIDEFRNYQWPRGDGQMEETKSHPVVVACFRNMRQPIVFCCSNVDEQRKLHNCLVAVQRLLHKRVFEDLSQRGRDNLPDSPLPKIMLVENKARKYVDNFEAFDRQRKLFLERLSLIAKKLKTDNAIKQYLNAAKNDELQTRVILWNPRKGKYEKRKVSVWIHHHAPYIMVTDRKGRTTQPGLDAKLDLLSIWLCRTPEQVNKTCPSEIRGKKRLRSLVSLDLLDHQDKRMYFCFDDVQRVWDFQQTVATLSYLQQYATKDH